MTRVTILRFAQRAQEEKVLTSKPLWLECLLIMSPHTFFVYLMLLLVPLIVLCGGEAGAAGEAVVFHSPTTSAMTLVPLNEKGIVLDGNLEEKEWFQACAFTGFMCNSTRVFAPRQTIVYVCYDADNLWMAFQSDAPVDRDAEKMILALKPRSDVYTLIVGPSGNVAPVAGPVLKAPVHAVSRIKDGRWTCEVSVPFASMSTAQPGDGETWQANFARIFSTPHADTSWVSRSGADPLTFAENESGQLLFKKDGPYLKVTSVGRLDESRMRVNGTYFERPSSGGARKGDLWVDFPLVSGGRTIGYGQTVYYVQGEQKPMSVVSDAGGGTEEETIGDKNPHRRCDSVVIGVGHGWETGKPVPFFRSDRIPAGRPFDPLHLFTYKILRENKMVVWLETLGLKPMQDGNVNLSADILSPAGQILESRQITGVRRGEYELEFNAGLLATGRNAFRAILTEGTGVEASRLNRPIEKPDASKWEGNRLGLSDKVPAPFEPVRSKGDSVLCWGREYRLEGASVLHGIKTRGRSILRAPVTLQARASGQTIPFKDSGWRFEKVKDTFAVAVNLLTSPLLDLQIRNTIEYDGMVRVDMTLIPKGKEVNLDGLQLVIPIKEEHAKYLSWSRTGSAGDKSNWFYGALTDEGFKGSFRPFLWLGDEDRGLLWFAEWMRNWSVKDKDKALVVEKRPGVVDLRVTMIDRPARLDKPIVITFGLQTTPVRPLPAGWRNFTRKLGVFGSYVVDSYNPAVVQVEAKRIRELNQEGRNVVLYAYPQHLATATPAYAFHANEWKTSGPLARARGSYDLDQMCLNTGFRDFNVWAENEALVTDPNKHVGLLYDLSWVQPCSNAEHGCGYTDADGQVQPRWNIFAIRDYYKRVYTLYRQKMKQTFIIAHSSSNNLLVPFYSFCDGAWNGEQYAYFVRDYVSEIPLDQWKAEFTCRQFGMIPIFMPELRYYTEARGTWSAATMIYLHDLLYQAGFYDAKVMAGFEKVRDEFGVAQPDVKFIPYWEAMGRTFHSTIPEVLVSAYTRPGKAMLVVGNLSDKVLEPEIRIDFKNLKVNPAVVRVHDGISVTTTPVSEGKIKVRINAKSPVLVTTQ